MGIPSPGSGHTCKSTLLAMLARNTNADAIVIGLVGERGREVKEFIEDDLGEDGLKRSVAVAATSDEALLVAAVRTAYVVSLAHWSPNNCAHGACMSLLLMDSVIPFRAWPGCEIGLSAGELPASIWNSHPTVFKPNCPGC